jgi:hypothetical protein
MILYVNGDSHTAAAEAVNNHAFAIDDSQYWHLDRRPHPDNLAVSWGKLLSDRLKNTFHCDAESASSNDRIIRTTKNWIESHEKELYRTLMIIQWSTWEREEWLIDNEYYQVNASGIDIVPESHQQQYKEYIAGINWQQKTEEAHLKIWNFHLWLQSRDIKHVFFNGNNDFGKIKNPQNWGTNYIDPYNPASTYDAILNEKFQPVSPVSYHYGPDAHRYWANYILHYLLDNKLV